MPRYIDADALKDRMLNYYECVNADTGKNNYKGETLMNYEVADMIEDCIDNAPAADVVEVVRCKDCQHWGGVTYGFVCRKFSGMETKICMGADHFCSYGERKTTDGSEGH